MALDHHLPPRHFYKIKIKGTIVNVAECDREMHCRTCGCRLRDNFSHGFHASLFRATYEYHILGTRVQERVKRPQYLWLLHYGTTSSRKLIAKGHARRAAVLHDCSVRAPIVSSSYSYCLLVVWFGLRLNTLLFGYLLARSYLQPH